MLSSVVPSKVTKQLRCDQHLTPRLLGWNPGVLPGEPKDTRAGRAAPRAPGHRAGPHCPTSCHVDTGMRHRGGHSGRGQAGQ